MKQVSKSRQNLLMLCVNFSRFIYAKLSESGKAFVESDIKDQRPIHTIATVLENSVLKVIKIKTRLDFKTKSLLYIQRFG